MNITVVGSRSVVLPAECVQIRLTTGFTDADSLSVMRRTSSALDLVRERLDEAVADGGGRDVRLSGLRTWTTIPYDNEGRPGDPQQVAQVRGSVIITDLTRVADLLGDLAAADGVEVEGLDWRLTEETLRRIQPEVLQGAFEDARQRAEWIAGAAGQTGLQVASIEDQGARGGGMPRGRMLKMAAADSVSFDLDPDDVEVSATLNVQFTTTTGNLHAGLPVQPAT